MRNFSTRPVAATAAAIATFLTVAVATPVRAETISVPVSYADLDLSTDRGAAILHRRISQAVTTICGPARITSRPAVANCRRDAFSATQAEVFAAVSRPAPLALAAK